MLPVPFSVAVVIISPPCVQVPVFQLHGKIVGARYVFPLGRLELSGRRIYACLQRPVPGIIHGSHTVCISRGLVQQRIDVITGCSFSYFYPVPENLIAFNHHVVGRCIPRERYGSRLCKINPEVSGRCGSFGVIQGRNGKFRVVPRVILRPHLIKMYFIAVFNRMLILSLSCKP